LWHEMTDCFGNDNCEEPLRMATVSDHQYEAVKHVLKKA